MRDEVWLGGQLEVHSGHALPAHIQSGHIQPDHIQPGQIWLAEQATGDDLFAIDRAAIAAANVVIYDRALEARLAEILALGAYAEPRPAVTRLTGPAISPRAMQFAADGWSVVQLVERSPASRTRWRNAAAELQRSRNGAALAVVALAKSPLGAIRRDEGTLDDLPRLLDDAGDDFLTLVCGPLSFATRPPHGNLFTASGLAG